ncbi:glycosyltransferase family 2 protein [archaeon]|jgi:dolichol-phosphate mannosyltransferase|nr:glycosyltransferase family 2 protein [archaeon]
MTTKPTLSIIIPIYNEKTTIRKILEKIQTQEIPKEIIIIDDGSTDGTREIIQNINYPNIKKIFLKKNYGKSAAIRCGIKRVEGKITLIQDADLEYSPNDYHKLIDPIIQNKTRVVYGTRFPRKRRPKNISLFYLGIKLLTLITNILYKTKLTDEATCYKVFDTKLLKSINLKSRRFEFCPEVTAKLSKKGHKIMEIPVYYNPRSKKHGKKIRYRDGISAIATLIKYKFVD